MKNNNQEEKVFDMFTPEIKNHVCTEFINSLYISKDFAPFKVGGDRGIAVENSKGSSIINGTSIERAQELVRFLNKKSSFSEEDIKTLSPKARNEIFKEFLDKTVFEKRLPFKFFNGAIYDQDDIKIINYDNVLDAEIFASLACVYFLAQKDESDAIFKELGIPEIHEQTYENSVNKNFKGK